MKRKDLEHTELGRVYGKLEADSFRDAPTIAWERVRKGLMRKRLRWLHRAKECGSIFVDRFCEEAGIVVEWELKESVWRAAGKAFQSYVTRRKKQGGSEPRRVLADFLMGAHALENGYRLLTADASLYKASFPRLALEIM